LKAAKYLILVVALSGCQPARPGRDVVEGWAYAIVGASTFDREQPGPKPGPTPGTCQACGGTGKVGDGVVFAICLDCDGTGKPKKDTNETRPFCDGPSCPETLTRKRRRLFWKWRK